MSSDGAGSAVNEGTVTQGEVPKLQFPEFRDVATWKLREFSSLLTERKEKDRELKYRPEHVLSVLTAYGNYCNEGCKYYGPDVKEIARHELYPSGIGGDKRTLPEHSPGRDHHQKYELLKQRFADFGAEGVLFLDELVRTRRRGKEEAGRVLGLLAIYQREDLARALQRAVRYRAFSWSAVERILAAQACPRSGWESLQAEAQDQLDEILRQSPVATRSPSGYQALLEETVIHDESDEDDDSAA